MKKVSISKVAFYAENPKSFCENNGGIISEKAVKLGYLHHKKIGSYNSSVLIITLFISAITLFIYAIYI